MALIEREQDDEAVLRAEDEAIREAQRDKPKHSTALDQLVEILNGQEAPVVHPPPESDGRPRR